MELHTRRHQPPETRDKVGSVLHSLQPLCPAGVAVAPGTPGVKESDETPASKVARTGHKAPSLATRTGQAGARLVGFQGSVVLVAYAFSQC